MPRREAEGGEGAVVEAAAFVYVDFRQLDAGGGFHAHGGKDKLIIFLQECIAIGDDFFFAPAQEHRQRFRR